MVAQIRPAAFAQWVAAQSLGDARHNPLLLDVRETWETQQAPIAPGNVSAQFDLVAIPMGELTRRLAELPTDRPIACLCHHGVRSQHVAQFLAQCGFDSVVNIAGGSEAWSCEADPGVPRY